MIMTARIEWISALQGMAMLMVVVGHCWLIGDGWLMNFCYGVHMPLFMFISGGLFYMTRISRGWRWRDVMTDKLKRLGIPYVAFIIFAYCLKILLSARVKNPVGISFEDFLLGFVFPFRSAMKEMWFVAALLLLMSAYPLWRRVLLSRWLQAAVLLLTIGASIVNKSYIGGGIFNIYGALRYAIYFYLGLLCFHYIKRWERFDGYWGFLLLAVYAAVCMFRRDWALPVALVGIGGMVLTMRYVASKWPGVLSSFRDYSFQIFLLGIYPQMFVELLLGHWNHGAWWQTAGLFAMSVGMGIYVPVLVSMMVKRLDNKVLNMVFGLK